MVDIYKGGPVDFYNHGTNSIFWCNYLLVEYVQLLWHQKVTTLYGLGTGAATMCIENKISYFHG